MSGIPDPRPTVRVGQLSDRAAVHLYVALGWKPVRRLEPEAGAEWLYALALDRGGPAPAE